MLLYKRCPCTNPSTCLHVYWFNFMVNGQRLRQSTKSANKRIADRIATKRKSDILESDSGIPLKKVAVRFSTHVDAYLAYTLNANSTAYKDKAVLDRLEEEIGDQSIHKITAFDIERWKTARAEEVEKSTVNRELNIIRGCFTKAVTWGHITISPLKQVKNYKVDDQRVRVLSDQELKIVLAIEDPFVVLVCRATMESLARISELLGLQKSHIGPTWVEFRKKGGRVERVAVTEKLRLALLARCHEETGYVFGEGATGNPPTQQTASQRVFRALSEAGVQDASHHTMRHTGVTIMLEKGVNPRVIQKLAGWSSLRMLERYGHPRDAEAVRAVSSVADYLEDIGRGHILGTELYTATKSAEEISTDPIPATA